MKRISIMMLLSLAVLFACNSAPKEEPEASVQLVEQPAATEATEEQAPPAKVGSLEHDTNQKMQEIDSLLRDI